MTDPTTLPVWAEILIAVGGTLGTALLALLGRALTKWTDSQAEQHKLAFIARLDDQIMGYVTALFNTEVEALKAAAEDGKLTRAEKDNFKLIAVNMTKSHVGMGALSRVFGVPELVHREIESRVEKAVTIAKNAGKAPLA